MHEASKRRAFTSSASVQDGYHVWFNKSSEHNLFQKQVSKELVY